MNAQTVQALSGNGYVLYMFGTVNTPAPEALPMVWRQIQNYSLMTQITWKDSLGAYFGQASDSFESMSIQRGQTLTILGPQEWSVASGGEPESITVFNAAETNFVGGTLLGDPAGRVCMTLFGPSQVVPIQPQGGIFLMFSDSPQPPFGVPQSSDPGFLIDMSDMSSRKLAFDINVGWSNADDGWGQKYHPKTDLGQLLTKYTGPTADTVEPD